MGTKKSKLHLIVKPLSVNRCLVDYCELTRGGFQVGSYGNPRVNLLIAIAWSELITPTQKLSPEAPPTHSLTPYRWIDR